MNSESYKSVVKMQISTGTSKLCAMTCTVIWFGFCPSCTPVRALSFGSTFKIYSDRLHFLYRIADSMFHYLIKMLQRKWPSKKREWLSQLVKILILRANDNKLISILKSTYYFQNTRKKNSSPFHCILYNVWTICDSLQT